MCKYFPVDLMLRSVCTVLSCVQTPGSKSSNGIQQVCALNMTLLATRLARTRL